MAAMSPLRTQERRQCGQEGRAWASKDGKNLRGTSQEATIPEAKG